MLARHFLADRPDVFVGVDAPDFNLALERRLRSAGIPTVHLVSPTVWAWRPGRVKVIRRSLDLLLCIFPFEEDFLRGHGVPARYVGHPLADEIPLQSGSGGRPRRPRPARPGAHRGDPSRKSGRRGGGPCGTLRSGGAALLP